jgi:hypothetical protein
VLRSEATLAANEVAGSLLGWVHTMRFPGCWSSTYWQLWVLFPDPVSPEITVMSASRMHSRISEWWSQIGRALREGTTEGGGGTAWVEVAAVLGLKEKERWRKGELLVPLTKQGTLETIQIY